ncbi:MAG: hypothetical protein NVS3B3_24560 [Aquirhabdus sp.]
MKDGDLTFLTQMPNLQSIRFKDRSNFNMKEADVIAILEAKGFDQNRYNVVGWNMNGYRDLDSNERSIY